MTAQDDRNISLDPVADTIEEVAMDMRRGARRASNAVRAAVADEADAIEEILRPTLSEQISELRTTLRENPADALEVVREIIRERPVAATVAIAATTMAVYRVWRAFAPR